MSEEIRVTVELTFDLDIEDSRKRQREQVRGILESITAIGGPLWRYKIIKFETEAMIYGNES